MSTIITKRQFPNYHKYELEVAGRALFLEVGKLAELANASVMVGYGDTRVLVCVTAAPRPRDGVDFFRLRCSSASLAAASDSRRPTSASVRRNAGSWSM